MLRGIYSAGTAMLTQRKKMDVLANNIANSTTIGFKEDNLLSRSFRDMLISRVNDPNIVNISQQVGPYNTGIHIDEIITNFEQGGFEETGKATDFFINGDGFFSIDTPQGIRYTRDGSFMLNAQGYLVNQDGHMVMGQNGGIYLGTDNFTARANGDIYVDNTYIDTIQMIGFENYLDLRKEGNNLYINDNPNNIIESNGQLKQGFLEASNVNMAKAMVNMLQVYRNYESNQRVIGILDDTLGKAVNDIGIV